MKISCKTIFLCTVVLLLLLILKYWIIIRMFEKNEQNLIEFDENFDNLHNGASIKIVPNIVHYIIFNKNTINFIGYLSLLSVLKFHQPNRIFIHTNMKYFEGYYWDKIMETQKLYNTKIELVSMMRPTHVYGQLLSSVYHASDVSRIQILRLWGGIYLDTDMLVLKSLEKFRYFEITIGWPEKQYIGTQIIICNKNARFLKYWLESYQNYKPSEWYYNAGQLPTEGILEKYPDLVHRVKNYFGVHYLIHNLYTNESWAEWKNYYALHLLSRHTGAPTYLNQTIVDSMETPFGEIARKILYT